MYYLAEDAHVCILEPGLRTQAWFLPGFSLIFLAAGCAMAVFLPKALRQQTRSEPAAEPPTAMGTRTYPPGSMPLYFGHMTSGGNRSSTPCVPSFRRPRQL